ncbi:MAG: sulfite oxidase-like oxidoreductase [Planctomycetaceae bacterium]|nr:sulfite oxidase-like oxidoreductase [Planctomycetaceae bacterium]
MTMQDPKYQSGNPKTPDQIPEGIIISSDTFREERIPPGQSRTRKWPVLQAGSVPHVSQEDWSLTVGGLVDRPQKWTWDEFQQLPRVKVFSDFHCVTKWSRLDNLWEGVATRTIAELVGVQPSARFVIAEGYDRGWTTNLPLDRFLSEDALLCDLHDGEFLSDDHGGPVRLIVPLLYAWKSAKWLKSITFVAEDQPGYWEQGGYHNEGDPWLEQRFGSDQIPPGYYD